MIGSSMIPPELLEPDIERFRVEAAQQLGFVPAKVSILCDEVERLRKILDEIRDYAMTATQTLVKAPMREEIFYEIRRMAAFRVRAPLP